MSENVQNLTTAFPAVVKTIERLAADDMAAIAPSGDTQTLEQLKTVAENADPVLEKLIIDALTGHVYQKTVVEGNAQALYGDELGEGATQSGRRHMYSNLTAKGNAKVQYGDRVNAKSFWDS